MRGSFLWGGGVKMRELELGMWVGTEFQTIGAWNLKEGSPKDWVFVLGTERSLSLFDLREREGS